MKKTNILSLLTFLIMTYFCEQGCKFYPNSDARIEDLDMVFTYYDNSADFSNYHTYAITSQVIPISEDTSDTPDEVNGHLSSFIISQINNNMEALGYQKVDTSENPDVAINVGAAVTTNIVVSSNYPYYYYWNDGYWVDPGYWWGYYDYGYYYNWYPAHTVSSYDVGTLTIDMIDLKDESVMQDSQLNLIWTAVLKGLVSSYTSSNRKRAQVNIDQAFDQSPYLKLGGD